MPEPEPPPTPEPEPEPTGIMKTRDQVKQVMSNYCNLHDARGKVQFSPFIGGYPLARQLEWVQNELNAHSTHFFVSVDVNGYAAMEDDELHTVNFYLEDRWEAFGDLIRRLWNRGLTPVIFVHSGDRYAGDEYYQGFCTWWNTHFAAFTEQVIFVNGWETRRKSCGHTAYEFNRSNLFLRDGLGPQAILAFHGSPGAGVFGSHAPVEDDDPWKDMGESDNWNAAVNPQGERLCGPEFEPLLFQTVYADDDDRDEFGQPKWYNLAMDTAERFLPAGTPMPGAVGQRQFDHEGAVHERNGHAEPDWFGRSRERGRPVLIAAEYVAWGYIRGYVSDTRVKEVAQKLQSFGFQYFGNGQP